MVNQIGKNVMVCFKVEALSKHFCGEA